MNKILVTPRSITKNGHLALQSLTDSGYEIVFSTPGVQADEDELIGLLPGCVGYLAGVEKVSARVLEAAPSLKVISRNGTGIDNIDLEAAQRLGIKVCRAEGANARGVAELALAMMLSLARSIPFGDAAIKSNGWERRQGVEMEGRSLGIIGCGQIGKLVAGFGLALGMRVSAYDICKDESFKPSNRFAYAELEKVLAESDFISLHCPPKRGKPIIDEAAIAGMKKGVYIINTARAGLLDEEAVLRAIGNGHISGVATDVFENEPPSAGDFISSDRVITSPHIGGFTVESVSRAVTVAVENLIAALR